MIKAWSDEAWEDFEYWLRNDKKTLKRILTIIKDIKKITMQALVNQNR